MNIYHLKLVRGRTWFLTIDSESTPLQIYRNLTQQAATAQAAEHVSITGGRLRIYRRNGLFGTELVLEKAAKRNDEGN